MYSNSPDLNVTIDRYRESVRNGERNALLASVPSFQPSADDGMVRRVANWLSAQWMSLADSLHHAGRRAALGGHSAR